MTVVFHPEAHDEMIATAFFSFQIRECDGYHRELMVILYCLGTQGFWLFHNLQALNLFGVRAAAPSRYGTPSVGKVMLTLKWSSESNRYGSGFYAIDGPTSQE